MVGRVYANKFRQKRNKVNLKTTFLLILGFLFLLAQSSCSAQVAIEPTTTAALTPILESTNINTLAPTSTPTARASLTLIQTPDDTRQIRHSTVVANQTAEQAANLKPWSEQETQIAQFPSICEDINSVSSNISPDGKWFAASCGYKKNQTLTVQSKDGTKWILDFNDFVSSKTPEGVMGLLSPKFWSPEGNYLFFTIGLGYDGGGNYCFPYDRGSYGLFRLNLSTGSWSTVIPTTDSFPGYEIEFSPTGRRYGITLNGVMIVDLRTDKSIQIETDGTIERLRWSPNGKYLAYSLAKCDDEKVISSSVYIWDATTNQTEVLFKMDGVILKPESWIDNSTLRIIEERISDLNSLYTIYEYGIEPKNLLFTGTATPYP
jgi:Tol biopolymer transport system component